MGDVYLGYEEALQRPVAIKVLPADLARDDDFVRRFHAEATAVAKLAHPNIVPIYFIGQDAGCHFFVMQYVEGESLDRLLARKGRLGVDGGAGRAGAVPGRAGRRPPGGPGPPGREAGQHPSGRQDGPRLVADFGLVKTAGSGGGMTATGMVLGTVDYIAPEQARGRDVDGRADLYALGVLAYQMLSGRLPFRADTPSAMIFQHAYETPTPLGEAAPETPGAAGGGRGQADGQGPGGALPELRGGAGRLPSLAHRRAAVRRWGEAGRRAAVADHSGAGLGAAARVALRPGGGGLVAEAARACCWTGSRRGRRNSPRGCRTRNNRSMGRWPSTGVGGTGWPA